MSYTESNIFKQMLLNATTQIGDTQASPCYTGTQTYWNSSHYDAERIESAGALGEDSRRQFKQDMQSPDALAAEMAAFANSRVG
jgi:hypothetical protein